MLIDTFLTGSTFAAETGDSSGLSAEPTGEEPRRIILYVGPGETDDTSSLSAEPTGEEPRRIILYVGPGETDGGSTQSAYDSGDWML